MERVRRTGVAARSKAVSVGGSHAFDPTLPWEWVFRLTAEDSQFWRRELEEPALLIKTRVDKLSANVDDDAPLSRASARRAGSSTDGPPPKKRKTRPAVERVHHTDSEGYFTHNRRGTKLCAAFQKGECTTTGPSGTCPRDGSLVHQCSKCLYLGHGKHQCHATEFRRDNTGKGRGKGKAKGKHGYQN